MKCEKLNFRKSQGINQISFKNGAWMERSSRNFKPISSNRKCEATFASWNRYFTENSRWVPLILRQCFIFQDYYNQLFGIKTITSSSISQALCLPVSVSELVEVNQSDRVSSVLVFFAITFCFWWFKVVIPQYKCTYPMRMLKFWLNVHFWMSFDVNVINRDL